MYNSNKKIKPRNELEKDLEYYQDQYDKHDNNPVLQSRISVAITKIIHQLKLWDDLFKSVEK